MKRIIALLLAIVMSCTLAACGGESDKAIDTDIENSTDLDRSFTHAGMGGYACDTEDTLYFLQTGVGNMIHYLDKETGISGPLCGKPDCLHNGTSCNAYFFSAEMLSLYDGRLYFVERNYSDVTVYSMALDGTDRREMRKVDAKLYPSTYRVTFVLLHRGYVYAAFIKNEIENGEEVSSSYVCAFSLDPEEEPFVIMDEETDLESDIVIQPYGDELYILTCEYVDDNGPEDWPYRYDIKIRRWNAQTREMETLYHDGESSHTIIRELWAMDDGLLIALMDKREAAADICMYDFESGELTELFTVAPLSTNVRARVGIADNLVSGNYLNDDTGEFYVILKDFEGNVLLEDTYEIEHPFIEPRLCGADDNNAYFYGFTLSDTKQYLSIISVALDGSGAEVMCTETED